MTNVIMNIFIKGFDCYTKINCAFERSNDKMRQASYTTIRYKSLFFASFNMKNNIAKEPCHPGFESLQSVLLNERDIQRISLKLFIARYEILQFNKAYSTGTVVDCVSVLKKFCIQLF